MPVEQVVLVGVKLGPFLLFPEGTEVLLLLSQFELVVLLGGELFASPVSREGVVEDVPVLPGRDDRAVTPEQGVDAQVMSLQSI